MTFFNMDGIRNINIKNKFFRKVYTKEIQKPEFTIEVK